MPTVPHIDTTAATKDASQSTLQIPELRMEPPSPVDSANAAADDPMNPSLSHQDSSDTVRQQPVASTCALTTDTESESDYKSVRSITTQHEPEPARLSVFSRRAASKSSSENERRTMTIETEIVPNLYANSTLKGDHHARSLKAKASTDTVRALHKPKKKKSRVAVVSANHVPTKSEIYAATITQAVDEVEDSDSDETFVYESNPRSPKRLSRTPSMTSIKSALNDRHAAFSKTDNLPRYSQGLHVHDERDREKMQRAHAICGKRSMKFANNPYDENNQRRYVSHTATTLHRSLLGDDASTSTRSPRSRPGLDRRLTSPNSSGPNSPRLIKLSSPRVPARYGAISAGKRDRKGNPTSFRPWSLYEDEEEGGSSSERSPFLRRKSSRTYRSQRAQQSGGSLTTGMPFIIIIVCLMLVVCIITAAALSTSQPLRDVKVVNITNVLVSKQELLFDLVVEAYNPNALAVYVKDVEISVFAQSPYLREEHNLNIVPSFPARPRIQKDSFTMSQRRERIAGLIWPPWSPSHGSAHDYPDNEDSTTLLLGRVYTLDSTLTFESRFFNRSVSTASAELRVVKPGHVTEKDGVQAWERVIQHSFELIIRGVIKYTTTGLTKTVRTAELYRTAHINPAKVDHTDEDDNHHGTLDEKL